MVTATRSETRQTTTVPRCWLLTVQVRNLLSRTTDMSQGTLEKIDKGLSNQWLQTIRVYGLDGNGRCHVGLELTIDWETYSLLVSVWGKSIPVKKTVFRDNLAPEVHNGIVVFAQAVIEQCLTTGWHVIYPKHLDRERINQELGFAPAAPLRWAGQTRQQSFPVAELPELTVTFREAVPEESPESLPNTDEPKETGLFERIKDAFG